MKRPTLTPTDRSGTKNSSTGGVNGMVQRDVTADPPGEGKTAVSRAANIPMEV